MAVLWRILRSNAWRARASSSRVKVGAVRLSLARPLVARRSPPPPPVMKQVSPPRTCHLSKMDCLSDPKEISSSAALLSKDHRPPHKSDETEQPNGSSSREFRGSGAMLPRHQYWVCSKPVTTTKENTFHRKEWNVNFAVFSKNQYLSLKPALWTRSHITLCMSFVSHEHSVCGFMGRQMVYPGGLGVDMYAL